MPLAGLGGVMACILTDAASAWMAFWVVSSGVAIAAYLAIERYRPRAQRRSRSASCSLGMAEEVSKSLRLAMSRQGDFAKPVEVKVCPAR
ncbi:MAG: hypothetical protein ACI9LT_002144 [Pseudoalteromonas distincta]|jgi:hypothetical protein